MEYVVSGREMKRLDKNTSELFHVPEFVLMEQAALSFCLEYEKRKDNQKVLVVCGCGNNGADGIAIARILNQKKISATVFLCSEAFEMKEKESESLKIQKDIYYAYHFPVTDDMDSFHEYGVLIDAVFGVGLSKNVTGKFEEVIQRMNAFTGPKIAVDVPSGISSDTGSVCNVAFKADATFTFAYNKLGNILWPGCEYSGENKVLWIGIEENSFGKIKPTHRILHEKDLQELPPRMSHSNKGTYGKVLVIAGFKDMAGTAVFTSKSAYRAGAGLVKVMTSPSNKQIILSNVPEVLFSGLEEEGFNEESFLEELQWADSIVFGPGMGTTDFTLRLLTILMEKVTVPLVLDADGLNVLADNMELLDKAHGDIIVTPHLKEMSRLIQQPLSYIQNNLSLVAVEFATRYDVITVLKDFRTIIATSVGTTYINMTGNHGMATGGSGDVLAGIIAALLVRSVDFGKTVALAVLLHGLSGDMISKCTSCHGMMASDILDGMNIVWNQVENNVKE